MIFWGIAFLTSVFFQYPPLNLILIATALLFCNPKNNKVVLDVPQKFFLAWIIWSAFSCYLSRNQFIAFFGTNIRGEGLIFWILAARMAFLFWKFDMNEGRLCAIIMICWIIDISIHVFYPMYNPPFLWAMPPPIVRAGLYAVAIPVLFGCSRILIVFGLIGLALSGIVLGQSSSICVSHLRSHWMGAFVGACFYRPALFKSWKWVTGFLACILFLGILIPDLRGKMLKVHLPGKGSRVEWIKQTYEKSKKHPFVGFGLDNQSFVLKNPTNKEWISKDCPDRTHNIFCDIVLQTGYVGLVLFLCTLSSGIYIAYTHDENVVRVCAAGIISYICVGLLNPHGPPSHILFAILIFGLNRNLCTYPNLKNSKIS